MLSVEDLTRELELFSGSTIGQHIRHILEFYVGLFRQMEFSLVCYDDRERDVRIESDPQFAISVLDAIVSRLEKVKEDQPLTLKANFTKNLADDLLFETSLYRELAYNLEHSIHHLAIIKIGISELEAEYTLGGEFGIAPSTARHKK